MQTSNNTKYLLVSALFVFASVKKVYAESEITEGNYSASQEEISLSIKKSSDESLNLSRQEELLKELLSTSYSEETTTIPENNGEVVSKPENIAEVITQEELRKEEATASHETLTPDQQEQLFNNLVNSLSPEEQEQFIELLEEATLATENIINKTDINAEENSSTNLFEKFNTWRCIGFSIKVALILACWELLQKHDIVENNSWLPKSAPELFKLLTGVLLIDDIKDFIKEFKKATEAECYSLYNAFFPSTDTI